MSIMEMSHRSKEFEAVNSQAEATFKELLGVGDGYRVLFLQGGASLQFAMVPMNFLPPDATADFLHDRGVGGEGLRGGLDPWAGADCGHHSGDGLSPSATPWGDRL